MSLSRPVMSFSRHRLYHLADSEDRFAPVDRNRHAQWTGEFRPPEAGEWYLSGAIIAAYRAPANLTTAYHIAQIVSTRTVTVTYVTDAAK